MSRKHILCIILILLTASATSCRRQGITTEAHKYTITMDNRSINTFNGIEFKVDYLSKDEVIIYHSNDSGATWGAYIISGFPDIPVDYLMGFTSSEFGWLIINGGIGLGSQFHYIYLTEDGGKTWYEVGNTNNTRSKILSGAGFSEKKIGFLNFIFTDGSAGVPEIYQSLDGGMSWDLYQITLPEEYADCTAQALSPSFEGADGIMPVQIIQEGQTKIIDYYSFDYGEIWEYFSFQTIKKEDIAFPDDFIIPEYDIISEDTNSKITQSRGFFAGTETNWYTVENNGIVYFYYQFVEEDLQSISEPEFINYAIVGEQYTLHCGIHVGMTEEEVYALLPDCINCKPNISEGVITSGVLAWNANSFPEGWCEGYADIIMANIEYGEDFPWYLGIMLDENGIVKAITTCYPTAG